jgi:hypothetical protein
VLNGGSRRSRDKTRHNRRSMNRANWSHHSPERTRYRAGADPALKRRVPDDRSAPPGQRPTPGDATICDTAARQPVSFPMRPGGYNAEAPPRGLTCCPPAAVPRLLGGPPPGRNRHGGVGVRD